MSNSEALPLYPLSLASGARRALQAMDRSNNSREDVFEPDDESAAQPGGESAAHTGDESAAQPGDESAAQPDDESAAQSGDESAAHHPKRLRGDDSPEMDGNKKVGHPPLKLSYINVCRLRWKIMERRLPR